MFHTNAFITQTGKKWKNFEIPRNKLIICIFYDTHYLVLFCFSINNMHDIPSLVMSKSSLHSLDILFIRLRWLKWNTRCISFLIYSVSHIGPHQSFDKQRPMSEKEHQSFKCRRVPKLENWFRHANTTWINTSDIFVH